MVEISHRPLIGRGQLTEKNMKFAVPQTMVGTPVSLCKKYSSDPRPGIRCPMPIGRLKSLLRPGAHIFLYEKEKTSANFQLNK